MTLWYNYAKFNESYYLSKFYLFTMILAYNLSSSLQDLLQRIEKLRIELLLMPLSPRTQLRLQWEAAVSKTYWSLVLSDNPLTKNQMARLLSSQKTGKLKDIEKEVINYKKALNHISQEWLVNPRELSINSLNTIYNMACKPTVQKSANISSKDKKKLNNLFEYLHTSTENPCIQAGIAEISLIEIAPYEKGNGRMARIIPYLYLYKNGYDLRGLLALDEYFRRDLVGLNAAVDSVRNNNNLTLWLEYFVSGCHIQLQKAYETASESKFITDLSSTFWRINDRQKEILNMLDSPGSKITNKAVQDKFKVSQITASRDLSKLTNLDLILIHGKGRSTYYTKA